MPTRLSVMAADCIILVSKFMGDDLNTSLENEIKSSTPDDGINTSVSSPSSILGVLDPSERNSHDMSTSGQTEVIAKEELLWDQLDTLLKFVFKLRKVSFNGSILCLHLRCSMLRDDGKCFTVE